MPAVLAPLAAAGIAAGGQALGGLLGGLVAPNQAKQEYKYWEKKKAQRIADTQKYLKPALPRYGMEKDMPAFDALMKKLLLGGLQKSFGGDAGKLGIDFQSLLSGITDKMPTAPVPTYTPNPIQKPEGYGPEQDILNKYGMQGR